MYITDWVSYVLFLTYNYSYNVTSIRKLYQFCCTDLLSNTFCGHKESPLANQLYIAIHGCNCSTVCIYLCSLIGANSVVITLHGSESLGYPLLTMQCM